MMLSFNNDPKIKAEWVAKGHHHTKADMIKSGTYGEGAGDNFKGCTMGCYAERGALDKHQNVADCVDGSKRLNLCRDAIFEGLSRSNKNLGIAFHTQWIEAVPVGVDTAVFERIADKLILKATEWKAGKYGAPNNRFLLAVAALYRRRIGGDEPREEEWEYAARDALDARAALAALGARDVLAALAALDALDALDARDALAALGALDVRDARDALAARDARDALAALAARDALAALAARDALAALAARDALDVFYIPMRDEYLKLMSEIGE